MPYCNNKVRRTLNFLERLNDFDNNLDVNHRALLPGFSLSMVAHGLFKKLRKIVEEQADDSKKLLMYADGIEELVKDKTQLSLLVWNNELVIYLDTIVSNLDGFNLFNELVKRIEQKDSKAGKQLNSDYIQLRKISEVNDSNKEDLEAIKRASINLVSLMRKIAKPKSNIDNKNVKKQDMPVFPDITPSSIKQSSFRVLEKVDFVTNEDVQELIECLFFEPECEYYYFQEKGTQQNSVLHAAIDRGDIRVIETEFFHYKRPEYEHSYVHIERALSRNQWEKNIVEKGPMFCRSQLELSQQKKRELEIEQMMNALPEKEVGHSHTKKEKDGWGLIKKISCILGIVLTILLIIWTSIQIRNHYKEDVNETPPKQLNTTETVTNKIAENKLDLSLKNICQDIESRPLVQQQETAMHYIGVQLKEQELELL